MKFPNPFRAVAAVFRALRKLWTGEDLFVSEEKFQLRKVWCEGCSEFYTSDRQCRKCSCFVDVKARLTSEKCPLDKW